MGLTQLLLDPTKINCLPNTPTNCSIYNKNGTTDIRSSFAVCSAAHVFDTRFANALRNVCPSCLDNCDNVTATGAATTSLNVSNAGISDLRGIEGFTSLQSLYVNFNNLSSSVLPRSISNFVIYH